MNKQKIKIVQVPSGSQKVLSITFQKIDPVVQLVRMPRCQGGGRGFESRPDRKSFQISESFFVF